MRSPAELILLRELEPTLSVQLAEAEDEVLEARKALKEGPRQLDEAFKAAKKQRHLLAGLQGEAKQAALDEVVLNQWADPERELRTAVEESRREEHQRTAEVADLRRRAERQRARADAALQEMGEKNPLVIQATGEAEDAEAAHETGKEGLRLLRMKLARRKRSVAEAANRWWAKHDAITKEQRAAGLRALKVKGYTKRLKSAGAIR